MTTVRDLALVRAGDKGNTSNIVVVAESDAAYNQLVRTLTEDRMFERFEHLGADTVERYEIPASHALNFVIRGVLAGGVTTSLRVDSHGKSLSSLVSAISIA